MDAYACLPEAQIPQEGFGGIHACEPLIGYRLAVREAACQAGGGRLVPRGKPELLGERPHVSLREAGFEQGAFHPEFADRAVARAVVAQVVDV